MESNIIKIFLVVTFLVLCSCSEERAQHYFNEGRYAWADEEYASAITNFEKSLEILPGHNDARIMLAQVIADTGDISRAKKEITYVIENSPANPMPHIILGRFLTKENNYSEAEKSYSKAISIDPESADYWEYGKVPLVLEKFEEAQKALEQESYIMSGMYKDYHEALAEAFAGQKKFEESIIQRQLAEKAEYYFDIPK